MRRPENLFETHTVSGDTRVEVMDPVFFEVLSWQREDPCLPINDQDPYLLPPPPATLSTKLTTRSNPKSISTSTKTPHLRSLRSTHTSSSGRILATYPDAWQGTVHGKAVSGDISITGPGFRTIKSRKGFAFHEVLKRRGVENGADGGFVEMNSISGDVDFEILGFH